MHPEAHQTNIPKKRANCFAQSPVSFPIMHSFWQKKSFERPFDLIVIGAGIVGLHAALLFKRENPVKRVCVVEQGNYPSGASMKNAGFACFGSPSELLSDIRNEGETTAIERVALRWEGLRGLRNELGDEAIGYVDHGGYELFSTGNDLYTSCNEKIESLNDLLLPIFGKPVYFNCDSIITEMGFGNIDHAIGINFEASIDTGGMMRELWKKVLSSGIEIKTNTKIQTIEREDDRVCLRTSSKSLIASEQVIVATNAYTTELLPELDIVPGRGQVIMTGPIDGLRIKGDHHLEQGYYYFRPVGNRILLGGGRELDKVTEQTLEEGLTSLVQEKLETLIREVILPDHDFTIEERWSGIMAFGSSKEPIVKRLDERVIVAVRSGGMGVAIGHTLGKRAANIASH